MNCQKYPTSPKYLTPRPKFWSISLYDQLFSRYEVLENRKFTEWSQTDLELLMVKNILYTLKVLIYTKVSTSSWGRNFGPFHSTSSHFRDTGCWKSEMHSMILHWPWTLNDQKYSAYTTKVLTSEGQIFICFTLWAAIFEIRRGWRNWKCSQWPQNDFEHLTLTSTLYALATYPWDPNFGPFCSTSCFQDIRLSQEAQGPWRSAWSLAS